MYALTITRPSARLVAAAFIALFSAACGADSNGPSSPALFAGHLAALDAPSAPALLGTASNFTVLGGPGVTCTDGAIPGDVGAGYLGAPVTQTRCAVKGIVHEGDVTAGQAYSDFLNAYLEFAALPCSIDPANNLTGTLSSVTLAPGIYCFDAAAVLTGPVTLDGPASGVWIFKVNGALTGTDFSVVMAGGGQASNVYWSVANAATMTTSDFAGTILAGAAITVTGGSFDGRALAKAVVTLTGAKLADKVSVDLVLISVTGTSASIQSGASAQFTATGYDVSGLVVPMPGLTWSVVAGGGTIDAASGLFTAGAESGLFTNTVQATSGSISSYATVEVPVEAVGGVSLGAADAYGVLAATTVTCADAPGTINADVGVSPGAGLTGFGPPCTITGTTHLADSISAAAQADLSKAFLALAAMPCGTTITADLGGTTLAPGVYCSGSSVGVTGVVTLAGPATAVFVIRAPSSLIVAGSVVLSGGALAKNVYWWVGSSATIGTGSDWQGNILAYTSITLVDNTTLIGRALAQNGAVTLGINNVITLP
ncbi:MAG: ice-binding family protein [Gemmatimonadales bacterium]